MKLLDLFSGIGGFHKGFEQAGFTFDWVGFSEIDKYASAVYRHQYKNAEELGDIKLIQPGRDLPDHINILCGGFPCQAFSVAGKRKGFDDTRGTLFFEIARLLRHYRETESPIDYFVLENVKGLLSHDNGRTFATIYRVLSDLGYTVEFELLNTRNYSRPQNRERIYLVGYIGDRSGSKVFPIGETSSLTDNRNTEVANTLQHPGHSGGNYRGMKMVSELNQIGTIGKDSEATRVYDAYNKNIRKDGIVGTLTQESAGRKDMSQGFKVIIPEATKKGYAAPVLTPNRAEKRQNGRRFKEDGEDMFTLTGQDEQHGVMVERSQIRRLTPVECCRLQGFPDDWNEFGEFDGEVKPMSDTQRYKQCGNAVTVNVVQAVAERIGEMK